ncbi:MAG: transglutaminaseTgpA domain-containing protein [Ilumatobacter sp.]
MEHSTRRRFGLLAAGQLAVVTVASIASVASFKAVFVDWDFLLAAVIGAVGAAAVVGLSWWKKLLVGETLAVSAVALVLLGTVASSGVPTPDAFSTFARGLVSGWAELLSLSPQFDDTAELRVLPFVLAWIATLLGGELLHRTSQPTLPALGPLAGLTVSALVTAENRSIATVQGIVIAVGVLLIGRSEFLARRSSGELDDDLDAHAEPNSGPEHGEAVATSAEQRRAAAHRRRWVGRVTRAAVACVVVGITAPLIGPRLPFADANERFDLRDRSVPPWDPVLLASPLVEVKATLKEDFRDTVMFTVLADQPITRWNVSVLGDYDGRVWTVGSASGRDAASEFRPVSADLVDRPDGVQNETDSVSATIIINDLAGAFVPTAGWPDTVRFTSAPAPADPELGTDGVALAQDRLRMNLITGTVAVPTGVSNGMQYDLDVDIARELTDDELAALDAPALRSNDELDAVPPPVRNLTADLVEGIGPGWPRVTAIRDRFVNDGFYDVSALARPGHSHFRLAEFLAEPDRLVGFEEQYAAAAATMIRIAELNSRIVVGYLVPEDRYVNGSAEVFAADLSAWVEVDLGAAGWVPIDVSPDRSREPSAEATGITVQDVVVPSPPPPPPVPPTPELFADDEEAEELDEEEDDEENEDDEPVTQQGRSIAAVAGIAAGMLIVVAMLTAAMIAAAKALRRRRRRSTTDAASSIGFAWDEAVDRYIETGVRVAGRATPQEVARTLGTEAPTELKHLVMVVERTAFHPQPPDADAADSAWSAYDAVAAEIRSEHTRVERTRMATDLRTIRRRH